VIRTSYDPEADAFYVRMAPKGIRVAETREVEDGVLMDFDDRGVVIGIEILGVRARASVPAAVR
jgi:uncharacterized protein YuzE